MSENVEKAILLVSRTLMLPLKLGVFPVDGIGRPSVRLSGLTNSDSFQIWVDESERKTSATLVMDRFAGPVLRAMATRVTSGLSQWQTIIAESRDAGVATEFILNGRFMEIDSVITTASWATLEVNAKFVYRPSRDDRTTQIRILLSLLLAMCTDSLEIVFENVDDSAKREPVGEVEGREFQARITKHERSPVNRFRCIQHFGLMCQVCGLDFEKFYGPLGAGFIEVHHRTPVSTMTEIVAVDPIRDLIPLCSNCHSMVHRSSPPVPPEELRELLGRQ